MREAHSIAIAGLMGLIVLVAGCAAPEATRTVAPTEAEGPLAPLTQLEMKFDRRPSADSRNAPSPPGLPSSLLQPLDHEARDRATTPLDEVLALPIYAQLPDLVARAEESGDGPLDEEEATEAVRAYVLGRAKRLEGDLVSAEAELRLAVELDPLAAPAWRELAEVLLATGDRPRAASAFRRALIDGADDPRALEYLSTEAFERRAFDEAIAYLARLRSGGSARFDPGLPAIVAARLGEALLLNGYLAAGSDAVREALALPSPFGQSTNYAQELASVYRRRASLWVAVGDAALQLGDSPSAFDAYDRAHAHPGGESSGLLARRVWAEMSRGNPAAAARWVLQSIARTQGAVDRDSMDLLRHITRHSDIGPVVGRVVASLGAQHSEAHRPRVARALVLAGAAVASDQEAVNILREWVLQAPADDVALRLLLERAADHDLDLAIEQAELLIEQAPLEIERYVLALTGRDRTPTLLLGAMTGDGDEDESEPTGPPRALLQARLLAMRAQFGDAIELLEPLIQSPSSTLEAVAAGQVARMMALQARWNDVDEFATTLSALDTPHGQLAAAICLSLIDRGPEALEMLHSAHESDIKWSKSTIAGMGLLEAQVRAGLRQFERSAQILTDLLLNDSWRSNAYVLLLQLAGLDGQERVQQVIEQIAGLDADNPVRRWLEANRAMGTARALSMLDDLRELERSHPGQPQVLNLLRRVWTDAGSQEALAWFQTRAEERPGESIYSFNAARIQDQLRRRQEMRDQLALAWGRTPGDRGISHSYERAMRAMIGLGNRQRADEIFEVRVNRNFPVPVVLRDKAERALARKNFVGAARLFEELFALDRPVSQEELSWAESVVLELGGFVRTRALSAEDALRMHRAVGKASSALSPQFYAQGITLHHLAFSRLEDLLMVCRNGASNYPERASAFYEQAAFGFVERAGDGKTTADQRRSSRESIVPIYEEAVERESELRAALLESWLRSGLALDRNLRDTGVLIQFVRRARDIDLYDDALRAAISRLRTVPLNDATMAAFSSDLAQRIGVDGDPEVMEWLYRHAIAHDPTQLSANNNLGYQLLEWGRDLDDAERFIEAAYAAAEREQPIAAQRAFVTDSLGWSRYKLGVLHDEYDDQGELLREGAVRVLRRAVDRAESDERPLSSPTVPIVKDHLGDALWAAGERDWAIAEWSGSISKAERIQRDSALMQELRRRGDDLSEMRGAVDAAKSKLQAAQEDREPEIARIHRPVNQPSPPPAAADADDADDGAGAQ